MRCQHEPRQLYKINEHSLAAAFLAPYRARDWYVREACGHVGLASKRTRKIHWRSYADPDLVQSAEKFNAWAAKQE